MTKHTPGPWYWDNAGTLRGNGKTRIEFIDADKDLIAAAPELLEALEAIVEILETDEQPGEADMWPARNAIAKARGQ